MQTTRITYSSCPVCNSTDIHFALSANDHTVSGEQFEIWGCKSCTFRFTQHVPDMQSIGSYYQSENYISHTDTSKGLINRIYHFVRRQTLARKHNLVGSFTGKKNAAEKKSILDIGAGTGAFVHYMQEHGWQPTGIEPDEGARQKAAGIHHVKLLPADHLNNMAEDSFHAITLWHVLEHVHALDDYLRRLKKIIKPGGRIFIAVPNYTCYDAAVYKGYWAAYDVPRHLYHFSPASMKQLLNKHQLSLLAMRPMWYDSFYISMLSEKYKTGHSNLLKSFFTGAVSNLKAIMDKERCSSVIYILEK